VGCVKLAGVYAPGRNPYVASPELLHPNFLEVAWQDKPRDKSFPSTVFPRHTLTEITEEQFHALVGAAVSQPFLENLDEAVEDRNEFGLEKYLEEFIVDNFEMIFRKEWRIFEDEEGIGGRQYPTDIGPIDILAVEDRSDAFVVIELKRGRSSDRVVGQILRYMGWVKKNLCTDGRPVKGLIISREADEKLAYALEVTDRIEVRYYSVSFKLSDAP
jgi:restriction system protein